MLNSGAYFIAFVIFDDLIWDSAFICDIMVDIDGENSFCRFQSYHPNGLYTPYFTGKIKA